MFSDYVRLTVQGKCHPLSSECYQFKWVPLVLERAPRTDSQLPCTSWPCSYGYPTPEQSLESTPPCASPSVQLSTLLSEVSATFQLTPRAPIRRPMRLTLYPSVCPGLRNTVPALDIVLSHSHALDSGRLQGIDRRLLNVLGTLRVGVC